MSNKQEFHCNGLCKISCFTAVSYLGYSSEAGVQLEFDPKFLPVYTDAFGDQVPEDIQNMGMLATISFELIKWDHTILKQLQTYSLAAGATLGDSPNSTAGTGADLLIGTLFKQCAWTFPVLIARTTPTGAGACEDNSEGSYKFSACYLGPDSFNMGTKLTRHRLTFHCLPNLSGQLFQVLTS